MHRRVLALLLWLAALVLSCKGLEQRHNHNVAAEAEPEPESADETRPDADHDEAPDGDTAPEAEDESDDEPDAEALPDSSPELESEPDCTPVDGPPNTIGPEGGVILGPDGVAITVPLGSLVTSDVFSIHRTCLRPAGLHLVGYVYRVETGNSVPRPTVQVPYHEQQLSSGEDIVDLWYNPGPGLGWHPDLGSEIDPAGNRVTADLTVIPPYFAAAETWGCDGQADFTPCHVVTEPDRDYDICIEERCVSPGCGDTSCNTSGPHFVLPDTNQRTCYDVNAEMACTEDPAGLLYGQDAQYGWDTDHGTTERFVLSLPAAGGEVVVEDTVTGLAWQQGLIEEVTWSEALAHCDTLEYAGSRDWRLPDPHELMSLMDFGRHLEPFIDVAAFPGDHPRPFWTSSAADTSGTWLADFGRAWNIAPSLGIGRRSASLDARCVRDAGTAARGLRHDARFQVLGSPPTDRVLDRSTGLLWQRTGSVEELDWQGALDYCEQLDLVGRSDWRLPSVAELASLADHRRVDPAADDGAFPDMLLGESRFWTSTTVAGAVRQAWLVQFDLGAPVPSPKYGPAGPAFARCVRDE